MKKPRIADFDPDAKVPSLKSPWMICLSSASSCSFGNWQIEPVELPVSPTPLSRIPERLAVFGEPEAQIVAPSLPPARALPAGSISFYR
jgi:hypothetical protein